MASGEQNQTTGARANPALPESFRVFTVLVGVIVLAGASLLPAPGFVGPSWPWIAPEFNLRFVGAAYLPGLLSLITILALNRWSPARLVTWMGLVFSLIALLVSFIYFDRFDFSRTGVWAWFGVYIFSSVVFILVLWRFRETPHPAKPIEDSRIRLFYLAQVVIFGLLGLALLLFPQMTTARWPYPVDDFHGRLYSDIILAGAAGALLMWLAASRQELVVFGISQVALGLGALAALIFVRSGVSAESWDEWGSGEAALRPIWPWVTGCVGAALFGIISIGLGLMGAKLQSAAIETAS
jgi:hypothetical protein